MCSTTFAEIIKSLERIFMIHGLPLSVTSDMGLLKDIWKAVVSNTGKPYHCGPKQMAKWKRRTPTLLKRLRIAQAKGKQWKKEVHKYLIAYRSTPHTFTRVSPA